MSPPAGVVAVSSSPGSSWPIVKTTAAATMTKLVMASGPNRGARLRTGSVGCSSSLAGSACARTSLVIVPAMVAPSSHPKGNGRASGSWLALELWIWARGQLRAAETSFFVLAKVARIEGRATSSPSRCHQRLSHVEQERITMARPAWSKRIATTMAEQRGQGEVPVREAM